MLRRTILLVAMAFTLGCGGADEPVASGDPSVAGVGHVDVADKPVAKPAEKPSKVVSGVDVLGETRELPPGQLALVFTNNIDGEIEPCG